MNSFDSLPPPPRPVTIKTGAWVGRIFLWLAAIGLFVVAPLAVNRSITRLRTLMTSGKTVQAKVLSSRATHGKSYHYHMTVAFSAGGRDDSAESSVPYGVYYGYRDQPTVPVVTMPGDPENYEVGGVDEDLISSTERGSLIPLVLWQLIILGFFIAFEVSLARERNLLKNGEEATGEVISSRIFSGKSTSTSVQYRYKTQFSEREGKASISGNHSADYQPGTPITLVYDRNNDRRSLPLEMFQLVDLAS